MARLKREHIIAARNANAAKSGVANQIVAVLSALMKHAIDLGWRADNPARGVKALPGGPGRQPWTPTQIANYRATAKGPARAAFELCLGTGQRIGDVLRMAWDDIEDGGINVVQEKGGVELWIPFTDDLRDYLATLRRGARTTIVIRLDGGPMQYSHLRRLFIKALDAADCAGCHFHGLRKNATVELIEAGCSEEEVMAITFEHLAKLVVVPLSGQRGPGGQHVSSGR